jgi:hypothetical protein
MEPENDAQEPELPSCPCGTTRESKYAIAEREYSLGGLFYLLWGGTSVPKKVTFRCVKCNKVFETVTGSRTTMFKYTV